MLLSKRIKALMLVCIMLFTIIFSSLVIIADSNHECSAQDCQICQTIQICLEKLRGLCKDNKDIVMSAFSAVIIAVFFFSVICNHNFSTLVKQKIKLSY